MTKFSRTERMEVKKKLKELRCQKRNYAKIVGISPTYLSRYLSGAMQPPDAIGRAMILALHLMQVLRMRCHPVPLDLNQAEWVREKIREMDASIIVTKPTKARPFTSEPLAVEAAK